MLLCLKKKSTTVGGNLRKTTPQTNEEFMKYLKKIILPTTISFLTLISPVKAETQWFDCHLYFSEFSTSFIQHIFQRPILSHRVKYGFNYHYTRESNHLYINHVDHGLLSPFAKGKNDFRFGVYRKKYRSSAPSGYEAGSADNIRSNGWRRKRYPSLFWSTTRFGDNVGHLYKTSGINIFMTFDVFLFGDPRCNLRFDFPTRKVTRRWAFTPLFSSGIYRTRK